ncbi:MAG: hypothetical protein DWI57_04745 [Chloroflexi bacterium]|nr:MAG: hypothetical protein DWI57_04745 [Chloroflexota bacterium]
MLQRAFVLSLVLVCLLAAGLSAHEKRPNRANNTIPSPTARYDIVFEALWSQATHPHPNGAGAFPGDAHWSPLVGALHKSGLELWQVGTLASAGMEQMAETGGTTLFNQEIDAAIAITTANTRLNGPGLLSPAVITLTDVLVDGNYPYLTLVSMVAPSPDWFAGVSGLSLKDDQGQWQEQIVVDLYPYDAGTEEGSGYSLTNPDTLPHLVIYSLTGVSPFSSQPVARLTLIRRDRPPKLLMLPLISRGSQ